MWGSVVPFIPAGQRGIIDRLDLILADQASQIKDEPGGWKTDGALKRPSHVLRCNQRAVVKDGTAPQVECVGPAVFGNIPTLGDVSFRFIAPVLLNFAAWLVQLVTDKPIVDVPRYAPG